MEMLPRKRSPFILDICLVLQNCSEILSVNYRWIPFEIGGSVSLSIRESKRNIKGEGKDRVAYATMICVGDPLNTSSSVLCSRWCLSCERFELCESNISQITHTPCNALTYHPNNDLFISSIDCIKK